MQNLTAFGYASFARDIMQEEALISREVLRMVSRTHWAIEHHAYIRDKWALLFAYMRSSQAETLFITCTYSPLALKDISKVTFRALECLSLEVNEIKSIEPLIFLRAPSLSKICLAHNRLVSIKAMGKTQFVYLQYLSLQGNKVQSGEALCKLHSHRRWKRVMLETNVKEDRFGEGKQWLGKIKSAWGEAVFAREGKIKSHKVDAMIAKMSSRSSIRYSQ